MFQKIKTGDIELQGPCEKSIDLTHKILDQNKAIYRIGFTNYVTPFKIYAGKGTLIGEVEPLNVDYYKDSDNN